MATLIKRPGFSFWIAAFDVPQPDGSVRRLKKSTKRKKRTQAMTAAIRMEELETRATNSTGETGFRAYAILSEAATAAAKGELSEARARELLAVKATTGKPATLSRYTGTVKAFLAWLGDKADVKLEAITKADV